MGKDRDRKRKDRDEDYESESKYQKHGEHHDDHHHHMLSTPMKKMIPSFLSSRPKGKVTTSTAEKIKHLINTLDEVLEGPEMDETKAAIGEEAFHACQTLQKSLQSEKSMTNTTQASISQSHDIPNAGRSILASSITPWKSSMIPTTLPPLPKVLDPTLEVSVFVHSGMGSGKATDLSYERLEWVGDAYMELTATLLISQTFPFMSPGKASQMRELLVKNLTLSGYALKYGFDKRAEWISKMAKSSDKHSYTKILGDLFEAYVAAVILSDPVDGLRRASEWLKDLWGTTIATEIIQEERHGIKFDSPMWNLRGDSGPVRDIILAADKSLDPKERLKRMIGVKGVSIRYADTAPEKRDPKTKLVSFTVGVFLDGWGETDKLLGTGVALGKKDAGFIAAENAMANTELIKAYAEKKKQFDLERAAAAVQNT